MRGRAAAGHRPLPPIPSLTLSPPLADAINVASRMSASAPAGAIQVSEATFQRVRTLYAGTSSTAEAKGVGMIPTFLVTARK